MDGTVLVPANQPYAESDDGGVPDPEVRLRYDAVLWCQLCRSPLQTPDDPHSNSRFCQSEPILKRCNHEPNLSPCINPDNPGP